jgi:hypothetical protein
VKQLSRDKMVVGICSRLDSSLGRNIPYDEKTIQDGNENLIVPLEPRPHSFQEVGRFMEKGAIPALSLLFFLAVG